MRNLLLGILIGMGVLWMAYRETPTGWLVWVLFIAGSALVVFGFDVLFGSFKEHELRAAWLGLGIFGGTGAVLLIIAFAIVI